MKRLLFLFLLSGCQWNHTEVAPPPAEELPKGKVVILLHGLYGSALVDAQTQETAYPDARTILYGHFPLALHSEALGLPASPELRREGMIRSFTVVPKLFVTDGYGNLLESLSKDFTVVPFSYDWRMDLVDAAKDLSALVQKLKANGSEVSLLAHSMGGLVAAYYLAYGGEPPSSANLNWQGAKEVSRAVFMGTPFGGSVSIFRNMIFGTGYFWNPQLLFPEVVSSFASSYYLLPLQNATFLTEAGAEKNVNLADFSLWEKAKIGLLKVDLNASEQQRQERKNYAQALLAKAKAFSDLLSKKGVAPAHLKILNVVGAGTPTLAKGAYSEEKLEFYLRPGDFSGKTIAYQNLEEDGDGSVPLASAQIPSAFASVTKTVRSAGPHEKLFADEPAKKAIWEFLGAQK